MKKMKTYIRQLIFLILFFGIPFLDSYGQTILTIADSISITGSAVMTVNGGVTTTIGGIKNNGTIYLNENTGVGTENWTNNSSASSLYGSGTVIFNSTDQQFIDGAFSTRFSRLKINNSSVAGVSMSVNALVSDTLYLTDGVVNTSSNYLIVTNTAPSSVTGYLQGAMTSSFINGNLRRYILSTPQTYGFPVGNSSNYFLSEIVSNGITGVTFLDSRFGALANHNDIDLNVIESGSSYATVCTAGVWYITPNALPLSALYDIRGYTGSFGCGLIDNEFGILKRADNSLTAADWDCGTCGVGIGLSANGGEGRLASQSYTLRKDLTSFSQFGIGKINSTVVQLPPDTSICLGDSIQINAGSFTSYIWSTGATTSAIWVAGTVVGPHTYYVDVINNIGVHSSDTIIITIDPLPSANITASNDVSCFGGNNGSATVTVSGGTPGYTYVWSTSPVQTTNIVTGLTNGIYYVTVVDASACLAKAFVTINQPAATVNAIIIKVTDVTCFGGNNGSIISGANGGVGPYTYAWNTIPPQNTFNAINLTAGIYTLTVTDSHICTDTVIVAVSEPPQLIAAIFSQNNAACNGGTDGQATVFASGGTPSYTYVWNTAPVQTGTVAIGLSAINYSVIVSDSLLCTDTAYVTITEPTSVSASIQSYTDAVCFNGNNGSATADATGGTPGYTFSWNTLPVQNTQTAINLISGTFTVIATDINGCTGTTTVLINEPVAVNAVILSHVNSSCNGGLDGSAVVAASGGTSGYTFLWNTLPAQINDTAIALGVGIYTVTVSDINNCTDTAMVVIGQPSTISATITTQTNVSCFGGNDGTALVTASGGMPGYTYLWNTTPAQTTDNITGLIAGTYMVTLTDSLMCSATALVNITEPAELNLVLSDSANILCFGGSTGTATVNASGGTSPYSYAWNTVPVQAAAHAVGLIAGTYTAYVYDNHNCVDSVVVTLTEPPILFAAITDSSNALCFGSSTGTAVVTSTGGTLPYSYNWSGGISLTNDTATGLAANVLYYVTVTDIYGCSVTDSLMLSEPATMQLTPQGINTTCGSANGSAWVNISGGTAPYQYNWSNFSTTDTIQNIATGIYYVTVSDSLGCNADTNITIIDQGGPSLNISSTNVTCNGGNNGNASVSVTGGNPPYTYNWSGGSTPGSSSTGGLSSGIYYVTVSDLNNCSSTLSVTVTEPLNLTASVSSNTNISCYGVNDGTATVTASGGTFPYSYLWSNGDTIVTADSLSGGVCMVTIIDSQNCSSTANTTIIEPPILFAIISDSVNVLCFGASSGNATVVPSGGTPGYSYLWNNPQNSVTATALDLSANVVYHVTVTDIRGCTAFDSVMLSQPSVLSLSPQSENSTCGLANGSATVIASGGTPGYSYSWNSFPDSLGSGIHNITAGTYSVTVFDANGCNNSVSMSITDLPSGIINLIVDGVSCFGMSDGSITATMSGGLPPFHFVWAIGDSTSFLLNLTAGTYPLTVTDGNGCVTTDIAVIFQPQSLIIYLMPKDVNCKGGVDGKATPLVSGGTLPYSFLWSTGFADSVLIAGAGTYYVTATDVNGCSVSDTVNISEPTTVLSGIISSDSALCWGTATGQTHALATGGIPPYGYIWNTNPIQSLASAINLKGDTSYTVTITDANNCHLNLSVAVKQPLRIDIDSLVTPTSCEEGDDGIIQITTTGGFAPYAYLWFDKPTFNSTIVDGLTHGTYDVKITDVRGCYQIYSIDVPNKPVPCLEIPTAFTPNGDGVHDLWNVKNLHIYPNALIEVYNRWGSLIYQGKTSDKRWDGTYNGQDVPNGSYVFIINLHNNTEPKQGIVTVIR